MIAAPTWVAAAANAKSTRAAELPSTLEALVQEDSPGVPWSLADMSDRSTPHASRDYVRDASTAEQPAAAACSGVVSGPQVNGQLAAASLCNLWQQPYKIRADAAASAFALNNAFEQRFGRPLCVTSAYRGLQEQAQLRVSRGSFAAPAGRSDHGWGLAIDFCPNTYTGAAGAWLKQNGPKFGWENPPWAQAGGGGPFEPWQWDWMAGLKALNTTS